MKNDYTRVMCFDPGGRLHIAGQVTLSVNASEI